MTPYEQRAGFERCVAAGTHREANPVYSCPSCGYHSKDWPSFEAALAKFNGRAVDNRGLLAKEINDALAGYGLRWPRVKGFTDQGTYILTAPGEALGDDNRIWGLISQDPVKGFAHLHEGQPGAGYDAGRSDPALVKAARVWGKDV
jgi:hypothetical protein